MSRLDQTNEQEIRDSLWTCSLENSAISGKRPLHHRRIHLGRIDSLGITRNHTHREPLPNSCVFQTWALKWEKNQIYVGNWVWERWLTPYRTNGGVTVMYGIATKPFSLFAHELWGSDSAR